LTLASSLLSDGLVHYHSYKKLAIFLFKTNQIWDSHMQTMTHYFGPNPDEGGTVRAAWQFKDSSTVWGRVMDGHSSSDPNFVAPGAIPWLLVTVVGAQDGPAGRDRLKDTTYIQRLNTTGGVAPSTGCSSSTDIGNSAFVPYTADYYFYR
jgi:hypothetical protein